MFTLYYIKATSNGFGELYSKLIFKKIVNCIKYCHDNNVGHLDIKPLNILLDEHYNLKITDFGVSKIIQRDICGNIIEYKGKKGTKGYKCPEMLEKEKYNCITADVFSLGVTLAVLVTTKRGFIEATKNENDTYKYIIKNDKDNYETFWNNFESTLDGIPKLSKEFKDLYIKMIAYKQKDRPSLDDILKDPWLKEINDMNAEQLKNLNTMLENKFKELESKINEMNELKPGANGNYKPVENKSVFIKLFENNIEPKKLNKDIFGTNNGILIKGNINPINFMNTLVESIKNTIGNCIIFIELLELKNNNYFVNFIKGNGDNEEHYEYFIKIREIIRNLL